MARPKVDPADRLKIKSAMNLIALNEALPFSGYALEKFFEPENIKVSPNTTQKYDSGKWRRFLKQGNQPGKKSLNRITELTPYAIRHIASPFWLSIQLKPRNKIGWFEFYNSLEKEVEDLALEFISNPHELDPERKVEDRSLEKLIRIGNDHAVSALIGLLRQHSTNLFVRDAIETSLYNILFNFLARFCPSVFLPELYTYLYENILNTNEERFRETPWPNSIDLVIDMYRVEQKNLFLAEDLMLIDSYTPHSEFYYWKYRGNKPLIIREMADILYNPNVGQEAPKTKKGLRWLIGRLNKNRPHDKQLSNTFL